MKLLSGLSFSWKRALGLTALRSRASRSIGIPTTRTGAERRIGRFIMRLFGL